MVKTRTAKAFDKGYDSAYRHAGFRVDNNPYKINTKTGKSGKLGMNSG